MSRRKPKLIELGNEELDAILERSKTAPLSDEDRELLKATVETLWWVMGELEKEKATMARLRKSLSITTKKTEKASEVLKGLDDADQPAGKLAEKSGEKAKKKKRKGHGRNGVDAYKGAEIIKVPHPLLKPGDLCLRCEEGPVYGMKPRRLVRLRGQTPIRATVLELERLRCNLCDAIFTAPVPAGFGKKKYDETAAAMIALLKYGSGMPWNRLERLESNLGIPLPASTQWERVERDWPILDLIRAELIRQAAQGQIFYNDDTTMKNLELLKKNEQIEKAGTKERTGMFTSGIVSTSEGREIALFFSGRKHAGENLADVLKQRDSELGPPIQMCDGLPRNLPKDFETLLANCLTHGRRHFVDIVENFPAECRYVIETLAKVYKNDAITREQKMSAEERMHFHKEHSAGLMEDLECWMTEQLEQRKVEPNSSLGQAFSYMLKRWDKLTLFLRVPGAPLDNNICERALKKAILHRKNALFYKTEHGAEVGDTYMSLIYTAELAGVNPFDYLTTLLKHPEQVRRSPHEWMPWNYHATAVALAEARDPPSGREST